MSGLKYREAIGYNSYHLMLLGKKSPKVSILGGHCSSKSSLCLAHISACIFLPESAFLYLKFYWFLFSFLINESQDCSNVISAGIKNTGISINLRPSICSKIPPAFLTQLWSLPGMALILSPDIPHYIIKLNHPQCQLILSPFLTIFSPCHHWRTPLPAFSAFLK